MPRLSNSILMPAIVFEQVLADVTGGEFESFMELASKLQYVSTVEGGQEMVTLVSEQAELGGDFQVTSQCGHMGLDLPLAA